MLRALRILGYIEGSSFLILLLIAMPLKRLANMPEAVTIVGMAHGVLFIGYVFLGLTVGFTHRWPLKKIATMLVASVLPLGTFVFDGALKREEKREGTAA